MGKIGDLWVRLGLKDDDYKKGLKQAKSNTEGFGSSLSKIKATAVAAWAAIGASVIKVAQDVVSATNIMSDRWAQTMASMKASYHSLISEMSAKTSEKSGWFLRLFNRTDPSAGYELGANAKKAGEAAAEMTKAFDAEFELVNSVRLQRQLIQGELNDLFIMMRDTTLSPQDRKAAANRYRSLLQPLADAEISVYSNMLDKASTAWQAGTGLSRQYSTDEMREFFANYGTNQAGMTEKYGELARVYETRKGDEQNQVIFDILTRLAQSEAQMSEVNKTLSRTELAINKQITEMAGETDRMLAQVLQEGLDDVYAEIDALDGEIEGLELEIPPIKTDALDASIDKVQAAAERYAEQLAQIEQMNAMLENAIVASVANGFQAITDMVVGIEDADMKSVMAAFLSPFADTLKQMGTMIMTEGIAMAAFKSSFTNPYAAIAAGAALIAIGSAVSSGLQAMTANPTSGGGSASSYGGNSYGKSSVENYESTLTIEVKGKVSGSDIILAGSNQQKQWDR